MRRFYVPKNRWKGEKAQLDADQTRHLTRVLRMGPGDSVIIFDGEGEFEAKVGSDDKSGAWCNIIKLIEAKAAPKAHIILAPAIIKSKRMDMVVEKATELGTDEIAPFTCERCVINPRPGKADHWRKIAESAAAQSGQIRVPEIAEPANFKDILRIYADLKIMLWEGERDLSKDPLIAVGATHGSPSPRILLLVGPEGGFTNNEVQSAIDSGFLTWGIASSTLRAETASIAGLSILVNKVFQKMG